MPILETDPITDSQKAALNRLIGHYAGDDRQARLHLITWLLDRDTLLASINDLTVGEWRRIRNRATPGWANEDFTIAANFDRHAHYLMRQYREHVQGQGVLPGFE